MSALERAMQAAHDRRKAAGVDGAGSAGVVFADSELQDRAVFSGFDIQYGELTGTSSAIAEVYSGTAKIMGLRPLFVSAWCDGLLTGLLLANLPPAQEAPDATDGVG